MTPYASSREERASLIANDEKAIRRTNQQRYFVRSKSGNDEYEVIDSEFGLGCSCRDHFYRGVDCKYIPAVRLSIELRKKEASQVTIRPIVVGDCPRCKSSKLVREGIRRNKKSFP